MKVKQLNQQLDCFTENKSGVERMVDVLPEWTVRGVKSSECVERKDGSESDRCSESDRKETDVFERHSNPNRCTECNKSPKHSKRNHLACFKCITSNKAMKLYADDSPLYT